MQAFKRYHFYDLEQPLTRFQGHDIRRQKIRQRYKTDLHYTGRLKSKVNSKYVNK